MSFECGKRGKTEEQKTSPVKTMVSRYLKREQEERAGEIPEKSTCYSLMQERKNLPPNIVNNLLD